MPISHSAATELAQLLGSGTAGELIPELVRQGLLALIKAEVAAALGADRHQRTDQRRGHRNGSRERLLATPSGDIQLRIPRFRAGSFFPTLLEPRRRVDRPLWAVVMEAYVSGMSTRKVDELVAALGCESGISKSEVSRFCQGLDVQVQAFLGRSLELCRSPYAMAAGDLQRPVCGGGHHRQRASARCSALRWATARTSPSGLPSCGASGSGGWRVLRVNPLGRRIA
jgi:transposase-like protein